MTAALRTAYCLLLLLATSCVYEYPDDQTPPGPPDEVELTVELALNIDFDLNDEGETFLQDHAALLNGGYDIRYIVDLYRQPDNSGLPLSQRTYRLSATEAAMPPDGVYHFSEVVTLTAARYVALVWVDFVPAGSADDYYYHTADLQAVTIDNSRPYRGYHISKDAFTNAMIIDLPAAGNTNSYQATVLVKRPFALYRIVADDVQAYRAAHPSDYAAVRPDTTRLSYQSEFPMGYDAYFAVPKNNFLRNVHYAYGVPATNGSESEVELAADFVLVRNGGDPGYPDGFYDVDFEVLTPSDARISRHSVRVNLWRNRVTVIRLPFLTTGGTQGGVGIDFGFGDEDVIYF
jgi:hypothetical protein